MTVGLFQAHSLLVEYAVTLDGMSGPLLAKLLHRVFALGMQKHNDRCILRKVQSVDGIGRHIQHTTPPLNQHTYTALGVTSSTQHRR